MTNHSREEEKVVQWLLDRWQEGDVPPWRKPWTPPPWPTMPHNPFTKSVYHGGNAILLHLAGIAYDSPLYATYKQIQDQGGQVRRGEHGVPIIVWKEWTPSAPQEGSGKPLGPEDRVPGVDPRLAQGVERGNGMAEPRRRGFAKVYRVFNLAQTDGLEALLNLAAPEAAWDHHVAGKLFLEHLREIGVRVEQGLGNRAYCQPGEGRIVMPAEGRFGTPSAYYGTLLHEAIHSSKNTLQRPDWYAARGMDPDQAYAAEELVAELGMLLLARRLNVPIAPEDAEQTASYLKGWTLRAAVEENPKLLYQTARLAQAAVDHLAAPEFVQQLEATQKTGAGPTQVVSIDPWERSPQVRERPRMTIDIDAGERYTFHADAGHGWLEVPRSDIQALDIDGLISVASYQKGNRVFLEEDRDALLFHHALGKALGRDLKAGDFSREVFDGDDSPIRGYDRYFAPDRGLEVKGLAVSRGDYVRYQDETGTEREGVVLDPARPGEATRMKHIYRWPNGTPGMDGADHIMPTMLPDQLVEHIPGAAQPGPDLDAIDPRTDAYRRTMGMDGDRAHAEHAVLTAVETARGVSTRPLPAPDGQTKEIHHKVVLTHRTDLVDYVGQEPIDPDKPILEIQAHPRQRISGVLRDYEKYAVLLDTREFGPVSVEIGKRFLADSLGDDYLRKSLGKPIEVSISGDGRVLSIHNPELGVTPAKDIFASPAIPFGLMPHSNMERKGAEEITGRLTHIHDTNVLEILSGGQPLLVSGRDPDPAHQEAIRKMIGHIVTVTPCAEGILQVADRGPKRDLGDSREIPVERLHPGDRIREGNHWMTVHSVEFPGDRIGLKNPVRIRFGDPEGDDTGSTLVPAGTRVALRTADIPRPERSVADDPAPVPTPDAPLPARRPIQSRGRRP
jgi:antirestriction protein ArdC